MMRQFCFLSFVLAVIFTQTVTAQISPAQNIRFRSQIKFEGQTGANIWGYAARGREYAIFGASKGTEIIDVTNPDVPKALVRIPAVQSSWREVKTYKNYAYITTEGNGQGLQIINLQNLPDTNLAYKNYRGGDSILVTINRAHALHIDTAKGFCYLYGGQSIVRVDTNLVSVSGTVVLDLKDPWNPKFAGYFAGSYIHDGIVENDTLYGSHVYNGYFSIIDFRNKKQFKLLNTQKTPTAFTHNTWLSANRKTVFTTDENRGSYLAAYDVSNPTDIKFLDRIRTISGDDAIVHNTYIYNEYAVTSWYTEGVTIVDAHRPQNLIQVGQFDMSQKKAAAFEGTWGVYPYLPSGNLIVSQIDANEGVYVLTPQYKRACYLEGQVTDATTKQPLTGVSVQIKSNDPQKNTQSTNSGTYATGQVTEGMFEVIYSKEGYRAQKLFVPLKAGFVSIRNVALIPNGDNREEADIFQVIPNPMGTEGYLIYRFNKRSELEVNIYNVSGVKMRTEKLKNTEGYLSIDDNLASGIYIIEVRAGKEQLGVSKFLKE